MNDEEQPEGKDPVKPKKTRGRKSTKNRDASTAVWKFPKNTLEDSLRIAQALEEKFADNPILTFPCGQSVARS